MAAYTTVIDAKTLSDILESDDLAIVDCRFRLDDMGWGGREYAIGHIPKARYAHLDDDLCGPPITDHGRHPLPSEAAMTALFGRLGISNGSQVIVYDDASGLAATRLWWMLHFMGHEQAAVLDGGLPAWIAAGFSLVSGLEPDGSEVFIPRRRSELLVRMNDIARSSILIDSRAPERYLGEIEPIDPVAGHIPGAINMPYQMNFDEDGRILPAAKIRRRFLQIISDVNLDPPVFYCGSGVTACNNLLAFAHAGLGEGRLYAGSWSEWCSDPGNPVAVGKA